MPQTIDLDAFDFDFDGGDTDLLIDIEGSAEPLVVAVDNDEKSNKKEATSTTPPKSSDHYSTDTVKAFFLQMQTRFDNPRRPHKHLKDGIRVCGQAEVGISRELVRRRAW